MGVLGYYLSSEAEFSSDALMVPVNNGQLQGFSVMLSTYTFNLPVDESNLIEDEIFYNRVF